MVRFTWQQLVAFEEAALRAKVPQNIPGLVSREFGSNHRWLLKGSNMERNGEMTIFNQTTMRRIGLFTFVTCFCYQYIRLLTFGWTEYNESHCQNKDNIVYDKLSARTVPYHYPAGVL